MNIDAILDVLTLRTKEHDLPYYSLKQLGSGRWCIYNELDNCPSLTRDTLAELNEAVKNWSHK